MRNVLIAAAALLALAGPAHAGEDADSILDPHGTFRAEQQMAHNAYQREMEREESYEGGREDKREIDHHDDPSQ
jgi:hypothetical protein